MTALSEETTAAAANLQNGITQAGSPVNLLWKPDVAPWQPPVLADEFVGWGEEQAASNSTVALADQSHHMFDLFLEGPDATRLLAAISPNDYENFAVDQSKQFIGTTARGLVVGDGVLQREDAQKYTLTGTPAAQDWVRYHAEHDDYDVNLRTDPSSEFRGGGDPVLFRYEIQGPRALELVERVFGGPLPKTKFFHSTPVTLDGRHFRAFRHGMTGQPGYEFVGEWKDGAHVKERLLAEGEPLGLVQVGAKAYATNAVESGWLPMPTPAIYTDPDLEDYRKSLSVFSFEGQYPLHGSYFSEDIEAYYCSPYELGYGRLLKFNHEFLGREPLEHAQEASGRRKMTVVLDPADVRRVFGEDPGYFCTFGQYRIEAGSELAGMTFYGAHIAERDTLLFLAIVEAAHAEPGTEVTLVWGEHPGPGTPAEADLGFERLHGTVQPVPYNEFARRQYRKD